MIHCYGYILCARATTVKPPQGIEGVGGVANGAPESIPTFLGASTEMLIHSTVLGTSLEPNHPAHKFNVTRNKPLLKCRVTSLGKAFTSSCLFCRSASSVVLQLFGVTSASLHPKWPRILKERGKDGLRQDRERQDGVG